jgi:hypothetical protein
VCYNFVAVCVAIMLQCVLQCIAVYCSVLQCVAVCCSVLQCIIEGCSMWQCITVHYSSTDLTHSVDLQIWVRACYKCVAVLCGVWPCVAVCCSVLQCVAVCCSVLQCVIEGCSVLQCITVHYSSTDLTHSVDLQIWVRACCNCVALHCSTSLCVAVL